MLSLPPVSVRTVSTTAWRASGGPAPASSRSSTIAKSTSESAELSISAARRSESCPRRTPRPPVRKPFTSPLWAKSHGPEAKGAVQVSSIGDGGVASRTDPRTAPERTTPAMLAKDRSAHMGHALRYRAGSGRALKSYQPTPNPSTLTWPLRWYRGSQVWRSNEWGGCSSNASRLTSGPR